MNPYLEAARNPNTFARDVLFRIRNVIDHHCNQGNPAMTAPTIPSRIRIVLSGDRSTADMIETVRRLGAIDIHQDEDGALTAIYTGDIDVITDLHGVSLVERPAPPPYMPPAPKPVRVP